MSFSITCFDYALQPGGPNASCCEQTTDALLAYQRWLWMGKSVTLKSFDDKWEVSYGMKTCLSNFAEAREMSDEKFVKLFYRTKLEIKLGKTKNDIPCKGCVEWYFSWNPWPIESKPIEACCFIETCCFIGLNGIALSILGTIANIPSVLLGGIGMPFKVAILGCDDKAASYSKLAKIYLKLENLNLKKSVLDTMLQEIKTKMEDKEQTAKDLVKNEQEMKSARESELMNLKKNIANLETKELLKELHEKTALLNKIQGNETSNLARIKTTKLRYESLKNDQTVLQKELQRITEKITQNKVFLTCEQDYYFS